MSNKLYFENDCSALRIIKTRNHSYMTDCRAVIYLDKLSLKELQLIHEQVEEAITSCVEGIINLEKPYGQ